ncbi:MAG: helix-turn-helix domain-containing protein [Firmicutes bacterium]|nr:helix-turn-helix domain-containing protein [Bacillota bacterium]
MENKKISLSDLFFEIGKLVKAYEDNSSIVKEEKDEEKLYSINQVIQLYPLLSKHLITNAINGGELKVTWIGNKRYFKLNDIDDYLKQKQEKVVNSIPETIQSWRNK